MPPNFNNALKEELDGLSNIFNDMKINIFKHTAIALLLAGCFYSCVKVSVSGGDVPYVPCHCEEKKSSLDEEPFQGEAYLFKDSIPEQMSYEIGAELSKTYRVYLIVFDSKTNSAYLNSGAGSTRSTGEICNFPDFVKDWKIPKNGCKVYVEGLAYESCVPKYGFGVTYYDVVLTSLKKK